MQHILLTVVQLTINNEVPVDQPLATVHCMHFGVGELHVPLLHVAKFIPIII